MKQVGSPYSAEFQKDSFIVELNGVYLIVDMLYYTVTKTKYQIAVIASQKTWKLSIDLL